MTDLRIKRTLHAIHTAFITLLQNDEFEQISVIMICEKAMINPKTFYKYYAGKSALAGELIKNFKEKLGALQQERLNNPDLPSFFEKVSQFFFDERFLVLALWKINTRRHHLWDDMHLMIEQTFITHAQTHRPKSNEKEWQFQAHLFAIMLLNALKYQLEKGEILPMNVLFAQFDEMITLVKK